MQRGTTFLYVRLAKLFVGPSRPFSCTIGIRMLVIDGSQGEGGGQVLRTALALSLVTNTPFRIENIRARRSRPGLMRQHLTAVKAAAEVGRAHVSGDEVGSKQLEFRPRDAQPGEYRFSVGTAGSVTLVFQTILPALLSNDSPSMLILEGGTHNPMAPPFEFLSRVYAPLVAKMGVGLGLELQRAGFYPAGGGRFRAVVQPGRLRPIELLDRGAIIRRRATAIFSSLPFSVAQRELDAVKRTLQFTDEECRPQEVDSAGPGNVLSIEIECGNVTEIISAFGEKGVRAEVVADQACAETVSWLDAGVPVGPHLADQLLLLMAMAGGGSFRTVEPTLHTTTQIEVIRRFLTYDIVCERESERVWRVEVRS
jgi:RNA 3'-terminal phosphate cyclase (ATP)